MNSSPICERCHQPKLPTVYLPYGSGSRVENGTLYLDMILDPSMPEFECLCDVMAKPDAKMSIFLNDITKLRTDVFVNAANSQLMAGGGVCGAIHKAAGPGLEAECKALYPNGIRPGEAVATSGFASNAKWIVHVVAPRATSDGWGEIEILLSAYRNAILVADELGAKSIAIPSLGTGSYGWDVGKVALPVIRDAIAPLLSQVKNLEMVIVCCFTQPDAETYSQALQQVFPNSQRASDLALQSPAVAIQPAPEHSPLDANSPLDSFSWEELVRDAEIRADVRREMVKRGYTIEQVEELCEALGYPPMPFLKRDATFAIYHPGRGQVEAIFLYFSWFDSHMFSYTHPSLGEWSTVYDEDDFEDVVYLNNNDGLQVWELKVADEFRDDEMPGAERWGSEVIGSVFENRNIPLEVLEIEGTLLGGYRPWPAWFAPKLAFKNLG